LRLGVKVNEKCGPLRMDFLTNPSPLGILLLVKEKSHGRKLGRFPALGS
jgi:hypothetical protein